MSTLNVLRIVDGTSVDGPGLRTSIYLAGCHHHCEGCHNEQSWDFAGGQPMTIDEIIAHVDEQDFDVTLSGGDPMYHATELLPLVKALKESGRNVWCYTGFLYEEVLENIAMRRLLDYIDVLVDGPFILSRRDISLLFKGSDNQRLIDIPQSLHCGKVIEYDTTQGGDFTLSFQPLVGG